MLPVTSKGSGGPISAKWLAQSIYQKSLFLKCRVYPSVLSSILYYHNSFFQVFIVYDREYFFQLAVKESIL